MENRFTKMVPTKNEDYPSFPVKPPYVGHGHGSLERPTGKTRLSGDLQLFEESYDTTKAKSRVQMCLLLGMRLNALLADVNF